MSYLSQTLTFTDNKICYLENDVELQVMMDWEQPIMDKMAELCVSEGDDVLEIGDDKHEVLAHVSGKMRMHFIKILPGDIVKLEISPYDLTRGRITYRNK